MAIHRLFQQSAFGQEDIDRMVAAYEDCLQILRREGPPGPDAELIAKTIIEIAQTGQRDPVEIRKQALKALGR
jgi:hypothetical protein